MSVQTGDLATFIQSGGKKYNASSSKGNLFPGCETRSIYTAGPNSVSIDPKMNCDVARDNAGFNVAHDQA